MSQNYIRIFPQEPSIKAFFSTKKGSSLKSPYENELVFKELEIDEYIKVFPSQVHKGNVQMVVCPENSKQNIYLPETDGMVTNCTGVLLTTVHADCLAVFLYDRTKKVIGLVHAGWKGTKEKIAVNAATLMIDQYHSNPKDIQCYISPGISQCCFETGPEVLESFLETCLWAKDYSISKNGKNYLDLKRINQRQLQEIGINQITIDTHCTQCEPDIFCSYRNDPASKNRMGAGICLLP